ncbi:MAG: NAD-dependent epimerase/dehydratase family protein [Bacteroidetes bacterium]|nr:NAD-dependent epimerase/dehydratase family protein [Bacteroidota bacterium]MBL6944530.1 NAD-dependent epimerase/dehydratase family protein [Bacteroidales bacterium]
MKIAITGASGHVGINLVKRLINLGHNLKVMVYKDAKVLEGLNVEQVNGSLQNTESLKSLCEGVEVVYHLAALISIGSVSYEQLFTTNVDGTKNVVYAAINAGVKKFIHFSSIHALVHEPYEYQMDESKAIAINSPIHYERTKALAEQWVLQQQNNDFDVVILNPTSIIGPEDLKPSLMGEFMKMLYYRNLPCLVPGGYDWVDVRDIVEATIAAIEKGRGGERYILAGKWLSIKSFADIFVKFSDKNIYLPVLPLWLAKWGIPFMLLYSKLIRNKPIYTKESLDILQSGNRFISSKKAKLELGFNPRPIEETIFDTYLWFKENDYL